MDIKLNSNDGNQIINSYGDNYITVNDIQYDYNILIRNNKVEQLHARNINDNSVFNIIANSNISPSQIAIFGTGKKHSPLNENLEKLLQQNNINYEVMPTTSAIKTFNILANEARTPLCFIILQ